MSALTTSKELKARFNSAWADRIPVAWPGITFNPPAPPAPWCRFSVTHDDGEQVDFGNDLKSRRYPGVIFVQVFIPSGTGNALALQYGDEAAAIFQDWRGTNIRCKTSTVKDVGATGDGYYQVNAVIPFYRDEFN